MNQDATHAANHAATQRTLAAARLEAQRERQNLLAFELRELRQTQQDTTAVAERLASVAAEIARLEREAAPG